MNSSIDSIPKSLSFSIPELIILYIILLIIIPNGDVATPDGQRFSPAGQPRRRPRICTYVKFPEYLDLPEARIATVMRVSPGTVKSATSRGLAALGRLLMEES